ncbi:MAG: response regulator transcription factor [Acidobacteriota bacterium]
MSDLTILLGDDHALLRHGLRKILESHPGWCVVDEAPDGREAVVKAVALQPKVAILDVGMPLLNGIEATRQIVKRAPAVHVLILSMHAEEKYFVQAVRAGAKGYLLKDSADVDLLRAVAAVASGQSFFSPSVATVMLDDYVRHLSSKGVVDRYELLSEREREVFQLVAEGRSNKEVAQVLSVSPATVETHRAHILQKLGIHNTAELVLAAVRQGLIS